MAGLLRGVRAIELGVLLPSNYLGNLLADQGAEVIKIESPPHGDYVRDLPGQIAPHHSKYHLVLNRNKKSVAINMRTSEGRGILHRLASEADVFFTNLIANQPRKMGADYETLAALNPAIVYCQLTAFGTTGPYAKMPAHGYVMASAVGQCPVAADADGHVRQVAQTAQAALGDSTVTGGHPVVVGPLFAAYGIAAALWRRATTGKGAFLEMSSCDCVLCAAWTCIPDALNEGSVKYEGGDPWQSAKHSFYQTKDSKFVFIAFIEPKFWAQFCKGVGREDLLEGLDRESLAFDFGDEALNERHSEELRRIFRTKTREEWVSFFVDHDLPGAPANSLAELYDDPQFKEREVFVETLHPVAGRFTMAREPINVLGERFEIRPAPAAGENTEEVLTRLGYSRGELRRLEEAGIIKTSAQERGSRDEQLTGGGTSD